jgi:hypothetical protein
MATVIVAGPYILNFGAQGLAPGQNQSTWWFGWDLPFYQNFTVTVTAHPWPTVAGKFDDYATNALWVRETSVAYESGGKLIIYATLYNSGPAAIEGCSVNISFLHQ